jgi:hypothetical protein
LVDAGYNTPKNQGRVIVQQSLDHFQ